MSILRRLFGLEPKKTEEPTLDLAVRQEKINESPAIAAAAEALARAPVPVDTVVEVKAQGQAPVEPIATPAEPVQRRNPPAVRGPRAKKIKK